MEYKEELRIAMKYYPRLYLDEEDFLHHVFFVNGNGYEWTNDGELFSEPEEVVKKHYEEMEQTNPEYHGKTLEKTKQKEIEYRKFVTKEFQEECYFLLDDGRSIGRKLYPICRYAKIMHVPNNVKSDWLDAAYRAIQMAESPSWKCTDEDRQWIEKAKNRLDKISQNNSINKYWLSDDDGLF